MWLKWVLVCTLVSSCWRQGSDLEDVIDDSIQYDTSIGNHSSSSLYRLKRISSKNRSWARRSVDIELALDAMSLEEAGAVAESHQAWERVLSKSRGALSFHAFDRWLISLNTMVGWSSVDQGIGLVSRLLSDLEIRDPKLKISLREKVWLATKFAELDLGEEDLVRFSGGTISSEKALELGLSLCEFDISSTKTSSLFAGEVVLGIKSYCEQKLNKSMFILQRVVRSYSSEIPAVHLGKVASLIVAVGRSSGDREAVNYGYEIKASIFQKRKNVLLRGQKWKELEKGINDQIWAARYNALVGRYETARNHLKKTFAILEEVRVYKQNSIKFNDLRAEAIHVLCFRIEVERQNYAKASQMMSAALGWKGLSSKWRKKFRWFSGLYYYLDSDYSRALLAWTQAGPIDIDSPRVLFWIGRTYHKLGDAPKRDHYLGVLRQKYPLSFYGTIGVELARIPGFQTIKIPRRVPVKLKGEDAGVLRNSGAHVYLTRVELALAAGHAELANILIKDLLSYLKYNSLKLDAKEQRFLAKLLYLSNDLRRAMGRLASFSDSEILGDPQLMAVMFPFPYRDIYKRNADEFSLSVSTLLAISRQESRFDPLAQSTAGALGLMQLMINTAKNQDSETTKKDLLGAYENIRIGGLYLSYLAKYYKNKNELMYASYNAGEYAVDAWVERRSKQDDLVFLELIPYGETRKYVQKVMTNEFIYSSALN